MSCEPIDERYLRSHPLPSHAAGDKHSRGRVLVIGGNVEVPGAVQLAGLGALRVGAGVLRIATVRTNAPQLAAAMPEAMVIACSENSVGEIDLNALPRLLDLASSSDAVLIGPGMLDETSVGELCLQLLEERSSTRFVLDAAAFTALRNLKLSLHNGHRIVCTPHAGEMAKFLEGDRKEIEANPLKAAQAASARLGTVIAMKGANTFVVSPKGEVLLNSHGTIGLATSGSGDTLAGILAGLLARGADVYSGTAWAVYLHAEAGQRLAARLGTLGLLSREIPGELPAILRDFS